MAKSNSCVRCGKLCYGTYCRKCFEDKNRTGFGSRMGVSTSIKQRKEYKSKRKEW